jgi:hypothetical protein
VIIRKTNRAHHASHVGCGLKIPKIRIDNVLRNCGKFGANVCPTLMRFACIIHGTYVTRIMIWIAKYLRVVYKLVFFDNKENNK